MNPQRPDHRHIYLLIVGLLVGIFFGPGVLGRLSPAWYDRAFVGAGNVQQRLSDLNQKQMKIIGQLREQKADEAAIATLTQKFNDDLAVEQAMSKARTEMAQSRWQLWLSSLVLALAMVMVIEPFVTQSEELQGAMLWGRYVLMAAWAAMVLAQPALLRGLPLAMVVGFAALAVGTGLPLRKLFPRNNKTDDEKP